MGLLSGRERQCHRDGEPARSATWRAIPNVKIERTAVPFADLKQKLLQGATAGELPDIAVIDNPDHQAFAALGVLTDLTERVTAWGQAAAYFEGPWDSTVYQGKNYGIPDNSNCLVLWYNTDIAGAEFAPPTNWDELTAAVAALTEGDQYGLAVSGIKTEEGTFQWLPFLWETGEDIPTIDSEGGRAALQLWVDYVANGYMSQGILGWGQGDVLGQFQNGKAAMMINGPWQIPVLQTGLAGPEVAGLGPAASKPRPPRSSAARTTASPPAARTSTPPGSC